jgi:hypothetical protein
MESRWIMKKFNEKDYVTFAGIKPCETFQFSLSSVFGLSSQKMTACCAKNTSNASPQFTETAKQLISK